jgi:hypothetical protein
MGFLAWTVIPLHESSYRSLPDEAPLVSALRDHVPETGVYYFPGLDLADAGNEALMDAWTERHRAGPLGMVVYRSEGADPGSPVLFVRGFGLCLLTSGLASLLLAAATGRLRTFVGRVAFVASLGLLVAVASDLVAWNWLYVPTDYTWWMVVDRLIGWVLLGLVLAFFVRSSTVAA